VTKVLKAYVNLPEGQMHYRERPGAAPAIVFLHQTASSSGSFQTVMDLLKLPNRLIGIDTPGFGGSFDPKGWPSIAYYAEKMVAVLDKLKVKQFHLFGHHTGTNLSIEIARTHPRRVKSLTLLGPVPLTAKERKEFRGIFDQPIPPRRDGGHLVDHWKYAAKHNPNADLEIVHGEVVNMLRAWKGRAQAYRAVSYHDPMKYLPGIKVPVLLMTSPDDYFYPRFDKVREIRPDADVAIVGGENFPTLSDAAGVAKALEKFMKRI
jgi:pimeloyl-ACP methyl ester carboxylesterase